MWIVKEVAKARYDISKKCNKFIVTTTQCTDCSYFMKFKVKLEGASCPSKKW